MNEQFLLERYKYVLAQKKALNATTFKIAAFYQSVSVLVLTAEFSVVKEAREARIDKYLAALTSKVTVWTIIALSTFAILLLAGGVASWIKYRRDEAEIEAVVFGQSRASPRVLDSFRWYETYVMLAILAVAIAYAFVIWKLVLPILA